MKIFISNILLFLFVVLNGMGGYAKNGPPAPTQNASPPPPPDGLIDENIIALLLVGVLFGIYIIYNHKLKQKRPV